MTAAECLQNRGKIPRALALLALRPVTASVRRTDVEPARER